MNIVEATIGRIGVPDRIAEAAAAARQAILTKPGGSLGDLEALSIRIAGIMRRADPRIGLGAVFVMAADHGVCAEGVSAYPAEVTPQMVMNFVSGGAAINALAGVAGCRVVVTDLGVAADFPPSLPIHHRKVAHGTKNMAVGPAMSREEALDCVIAGIEVFEQELNDRPFDLAATGDMGIGNTTASTAVAALLTGKSVAELVGRGTGADDAMLARKTAVIEKALELHHPDSADPIDVLSKVGGFELGALAGVFLASAANRVPVLIDGYISGAAALLARAFCPACVDYMIAGHLSADSGHGLMLESLGLKPILDLGMRLGEGTGAVLAMPICRAACAALNEMATFESAGVRNRE